MTGRFRTAPIQTFPGGLGRGGELCSNLAKKADAEVCTKGWKDSLCWVYATFGVR